MYCGVLSALTSCADQKAGRPDIAPILLERTTTPMPPTGEYMQDEVAVYLLQYKNALSSCNVDKDTIRQVLNSF